MSKLEALKSRARRAFDEEYARIYGELPPIEQRAEMKAQYSDELSKLYIQNTKYKQQMTASAAEIQKTREASQSRVREQIIESQGEVDAARTDAQARRDTAIINQESELAQEETLGQEATRTKNDEYTAELYNQSWNTPADTAQPPDDYIKEYFDAGPTGGADGTPQTIQRDMATLDAGQASIYKYNAYHSNREFHIQNLSGYLTDPSVDPSVQQQRKDAFERQHKSNIQTTKPELELTQQEIREAGRREDRAQDRLDRLDAASNPSGRPRYRNDYSDWTGQQDKSIDGTLDRFARQKGEPGLDRRIAATEAALANVDKPQLTEYGQWLQGYKEGDKANMGFYTRMVGGTPEEAGLFYAENKPVFDYMKQVKRENPELVELLGVEASNLDTASNLGEGDEVDPIRALREEVATELDPLLGLRAKVAKELLPKQYEKFIGKGMGERRFKRIVKRAGKKAAKKSPSTRTLDYGEPMSMSYGQPKTQSKTQKQNVEPNTQAAVSSVETPPQGRGTNNQTNRGTNNQTNNNQDISLDILGDEDAANALNSSNPNAENLPKPSDVVAADEGKMLNQLGTPVTYTRTGIAVQDKYSVRNEPKYKVTYEGSDGSVFTTTQDLGENPTQLQFENAEQQFGDGLYIIPRPTKTPGLGGGNPTKTPPTNEKTNLNQQRQEMMYNKFKGRKKT